MKVKDSFVQKSLWKYIFAVMVGISAIFVGFSTNKCLVEAKSLAVSLNGEIYLFEENKHYELSEATSENPDDIASLGQFIVSGDAKQEGKVGDFDKWNVSAGNLELIYQINKNGETEKDEEWHLVSDKTDEINGEKLNDDIKEGAILVQTSLDGIRWTKSKEITDYLASEQKEPLYVTNDIQLLNGCYYRVIVAYKQEKINGNKKILFVNKEEKESRKIAEVYQFYAVNEEEKNSGISSPDKTPRHEYDDKALVVNAGKDTGYSGTENITGKDVHYGWSLGTFTINGHTDTKEEEGKLVYLKNVGDQVTLWFKLNQDIDQLDEKTNLAISNDINGYDQYFQTKKTNMGRGTLIIQYTDSQNHTYDPVIYTDYLAACSTTSADTRVVLYEEGDYEVALDYEVKSTPRKVGKVEVIPEYSNYRTFFRFSVHNSNAMLYPFDIVTGSELQNRAITSNGFRIDLANSKDLKVSVTQVKIAVNANGNHVEDSRGTKAAKDGSEYTKEGIYILCVENTYTGKETTKTIYVGDDPFLKALASTGLSVKELDNELAKGYTISEDGSLVSGENTSASEEKIENKEDINSGNVVEDADSKNTAINDVVENEADGNKSLELQSAQESEKDVALPIVLIAILVSMIGVGYVIYKRKIKLKQMGNNNLGHVDMDDKETMENNKESDITINDVISHDHKGDDE